jgi:ubiquinone/menaquinone biosynthesis C-methylase UbiE
MNLDKISHTYDSVAKEYAEHFSGEHAHKAKDQEILKEFAAVIGKQTPVWDLGCGPGQTVKFLSDLGLTISGLDCSEALLQQARLRYPDLHFQQGNILELEFESNSVAAIISFYAFVHFSKNDITTALQEIYRVLNPGGYFLFTYHIGEETRHVEEFLGQQVDIDFIFLTTPFVNAAFHEAGFKDISISERNPYPEVEYQSRRAYVLARKPQA